MQDMTIKPLDQASMEACRVRIDNLTKPIYSLGQLEIIAERLAGIVGVAKPSALGKELVIFASDTATDGVQNKTKGEESLALLTRLNEQTSPTDAVMRSLGGDITLVDVGLEKSTGHLCRVRQEKVMNGSHFFALREAMSEEQVGAALEIGFGLAEELHSRGMHVVGLGNVGERAHLSALAVTAAVTQYEIATLLTSNECTLGVEEKAQRLTKTLAQYNLLRQDLSIHAILQSVGSPDIAAMTGFILGAAALRMAVVFDNGVTGSAVLLAVKENPLVKEYVFQSATYDDPVHRGQMRWLDRKGYLRYGFTVDEGLGSALGLSIVEASLHMLNDMKTFGEAAVHVAEDGPGNRRQDVSIK